MVYLRRQFVVWPCQDNPPRPPLDVWSKSSRSWSRSVVMVGPLADGAGDGRSIVVVVKVGGVGLIFESEMVVVVVGLEIGLRGL